MIEVDSMLDRVFIYFCIWLWKWLRRFIMKVVKRQMVMRKHSTYGWIRWIEIGSSIILMNTYFRYFYFIFLKWLDVDKVFLLWKKWLILIVFGFLLTNKIKINIHGRYSHPNRNPKSPSTIFVSVILKDYKDKRKIKIQLRKWRYIWNNNG